MAGRALFKGAISFNGISVPVKLYSAVREQKVSFHLLHDQDKQRLQQQMVCTAEEKAVDKDEQIRGFEVESGKYVVFQPDEMAALEPETTRQMEIIAFVKPGQIDPRYFDRAYHLGSDESDNKLAVLIEAMKDLDVRAVCKWAMRKKNYLALISVQQHRLVLVTLHFGEEVIPADKVGAPAAKLHKKELDTAKYLIDMLSSEFKPEQYHDEYQAKVRHLIEEKAQGHKVTKRRPAQQAPAPEGSLIDALQASVKQAQEKKEKAHAGAAG